MDVISFQYNIFEIIKYDNKIQINSHAHKRKKKQFLNRINSKFFFKYSLSHEWIFQNWAHEAVDTKQNRDICAFHLVKMSLNYWSDCMKIGMATIIKPYISAIESVQPKLFSLISDFQDKFGVDLLILSNRFSRKFILILNCIRNVLKLK